MRNKQHKRTKSVFIVVTVIIVNILFAYQPNLAQNAPTTYVVQRGAVQDIVAFSGVLLPRDQQDLSFNVDGTIQTVNVQSGDTVSAGTVLVEYSVADLQAQLDQALVDLAALEESVGPGIQSSTTILDAQLAVATARLTLQQTLDSSPISGAGVAIATAYDALEQARRNFTNIIGDPTNSPEVIEAAYDAIQAAERGVEAANIGGATAGQSLNLHKYAILNAENDLIRVELAYQEVLNAATTGDGGVVNVDLVAARRLVDELTATIAQSSLSAPFDGIVLALNVNRGDAVEAFETVITLALPEPLEVISALSMEDAARLAIGMVGICEARGRPETGVQCIVRRLPGENSSESVRIAAAFEDDVVRGEQIDVFMPFGVSENTLWLPPDAIRTFQSRAFVIVQTPTGETSVDITIGLRTADRVEILTGLNEGDIVIVPES